MKKILLLLSLILCYAVSYSQYPLTQNLANDSTLVHAKGALKSRLIVYNFTDTTAANQQRISQYSGAIIFTTSNNKLWVRNSTTSAWKDIQNATVNWGSIGGSLNDQTDLKDSLFLRLRISDTTLMLSNYINGVGYGIIKNGKVVSIDSATLSSYYLRKKDSVSGGYYPYESNPLQYITSSSIPQQGNHVINGLVVSYVSGLTFYVSAGNYYMNNKLYYFGGGSVTLAAADPSNDRQDLIIVDTLETLSSLTGTPAVNPSVPTEDPASQLGLTSVYIPAGATTPSGVSQTIIYDENAVGEWTISKNWTSTDNYATNPYHGSVSSRVTSASSNQYILFTASADKSKMNYGNLVFYVRNNSTVPGSTSFNVALFNNGNNVSNSVQLTTYGYSNSITGSYQIIAIPISAFTGTDAFDAVRIQKKGFVNTLDVQFDYIQLQGGIIQSGGGTQNTITGINGNTGNYTAAAPNSTVNIVGTNGVSTSVSGSTVTIDGIGTRSNLSATAPITYNSGTGVLGADTSTGATHLATQNYVNLFFNSNIPSLQQVTTIGHITNDSVQSYKGFVVNNGSSIASMVPNGLGGGIIFLKENSTIRGAYIEPIDGLTTSRILYLPDATDTLANRQWVRSLVSGGGGGSLSSLSDVNISSPANLQLLQYQTGDSKWHNWTPNYLAASDTSNKWVNNITRTPGKDSIIFYVGSTRYAIKDSVGTGGGGGGTWGSITGTLSSQTDLQTALDAKEPTITASNTVKKYWNGYKQWVALNSDSLTEGSTNLFYTNARARSALSFTAGSGGYNSSTGVITIPTNTNQLTNGAGFLSSIDTSNISNFSTKVRSLLSASAPLSYNSGTGAFSISQANTSTNGYLSNTDWNTFNNKFTLPSLTSGSVLFSNGTTIAQDNSNLFWDNTNKRLGIKVNNPVYTLQVRGDAYLDSSQLTVNMSNYDKGITVNQWGGGSGYFKINSASSGGMLPTFNAKSTYAGTGIMFIASGYNTYSDGAIVFSGRNAAGTGSITGGTLVDFKNYTTSYLNIDYTGRVGIGVTSPTGVVHIKAGTATAGTAPLKFTAGTNLTTTEAGAVEFDGTHLYFTATNGGTRYQLDQQSGGASALSGLTDVNVSSPSNLQLLQYQTGDSKWHNWTPNYITGNQTITLSGDATGSGATSISTTVGKINGTSLAGLATGILKNTTGTGVPSIAVAGDFPTLNQNTTGSAATLTTTRTIWGQNFNGSANVTGNITLGTSNITMTGSIASTGSRVTKGWFTDLESSNVPTVGGTSLTTLSQTFQNKTLTNSNNVLGGVTMTLGSDANYDIYYRNNSGVLTRLAAGTDGQVLTTHSTTSAPTWTTVSGSTQNLSWNSGTHAVDISGGGTSAVIPLATSSINGLSSSTDKAFLDSLRSHNSYIRNSIAIGDSLLTKKNDSTLIARRLSLTAGDNMTIATTGSNDSLLKYTIDVKNDTTALFTFGAGSGASGDTTAFSTSALYGSFYNAGSDSLIITSINAVMQGSNDTLKISVCFSDTLKAVSPSYVLNSYSINNNSVGKNATSGDFTTAKIPPGKHVYCLSPYVLAGRKPTYLSVTVIGYKKRKL